MKETFWVIAILLVAILSSCSQPTTSKTVSLFSSSEEKIEIENQQQKVVAKGETLWGYSEEALGNGLKWREIHEENPIMDNPGITYFDKNTNGWIVKIYPGETIKMGGKKLPSFKKETFFFSHHEEKGEVSSAWWWIIFTAITAIFLCVITYIICRHTKRSLTEEKVWQKIMDTATSAILYSFGKEVRIRISGEQVEIKITEAPK